MTDRIQLLATTYMTLDGQPQIVLHGTVIDVPSATKFTPATVTTLSPSEPASALASHGGPTTVRNKRTAA